MRNISLASMFLSIVLLLYLAINLYVLSRFAGLFAIKRGLVFWFVVFICTASLIVGIMFHSSAGNIISRTIYIITTTWLGILWLLFSTLIVYEVVRLFFKIPSSVAGTTILIIVAIATIYSMINAQLVRIKQLTFPANVDCNIVQLSDIHLGCVSENFFKRVIEKTNALNPDLILITGDLVDNFNQNTRQALLSIKDLKAPIFFVTGNHEEYSGSDNVIKFLTEANVKVLRNQLVNYDGIQIAGIDNRTNLKELDLILQTLNIDKSKFCIMMSHRPVDLKSISKSPVNLVLSGHTHAGQLFPFNYVVKFTHGGYLSGLHKYGNTYLYVTSGTGTWGPRMRLGSRSEIVLVQLRKTP
jgi:uncharacterized protein